MWSRRLAVVFALVGTSPLFADPGALLDGSGYGQWLGLADDASSVVLPGEPGADPGLLIPDVVITPSPHVRDDVPVHQRDYGAAPGRGLPHARDDVELRILPFPDVVRTPAPPAGPVPIPYPRLGAGDDLVTTPVEPPVGSDPRDPMDRTPHPAEPRYRIQPV